MTSHESNEFELDDDALEIAAGAGAGDWQFHSVIQGGGEKYVAKTSLGAKGLSIPDPSLGSVYSIPAVDLVSNFTDHHLSEIQQNSLPNGGPGAIGA